MTNAQLHSRLENLHENTERLLSDWSQLNADLETNTENQPTAQRNREIIDSLEHQAVDIAYEARRTETLTA